MNYFFALVSCRSPGGNSEIELMLGRRASLSFLPSQAVLEIYLQSLISAPFKNKDDIRIFFSTDLIRGERGPVTHPGYKEGYLTKRGKAFGGWKTRYFVLQSPVLEYYESVRIYSSVYAFLPSLLTRFSYCLLEGRYTPWLHRHCRSANWTAAKGSRLQRLR